MANSERTILTVAFTIWIVISVTTYASATGTHYVLPETENIPTNSCNARR